MTATREVHARVDGFAARALHRPGDGPTLVCLHGAGGSADTWRPTLDAWPGASLWCPDLPGRGGSEAPPRATAGEAAAWLVALGRALGWAAPVLVGHSYGGAVALAAALAHPGAFRAIVLASSGARLRVAPAILDAVAAATPEHPLPFDFAFGPRADRAVIDAYQAAARHTPTAAALADWRACDAFDVRARLPDVAAPALVIFGEDDALTPAKHQHRMADALPRAALRAVPGVGHMLPWEAPGALSDAVRGWLEATG